MLIKERKRNDLPEVYRDIPLPNDWLFVRQVKKGWSRELKFHIQTRQKHHYLLRVRPKGVLAEHQEEFAFVLRLHQQGIAVPKPHAIGQTQNGQSTFMLLDWMRGRDLGKALTGLTEEWQYLLGLEAGRVLNNIHSVPRLQSPRPIRDIREKSLSKITKFEEAGLRFPGSLETIAFVKNNINWLGQAPLVCQHGDFHPGNLLLMPDGHIGVIDFNRWDIGEAVEEFYKLQSFTIDNSLPFSIGQLHGYFGGEPETAFWQALAVHVAVASLYSIRWAKPFGQIEVDGMVKRFERAWQDYEGFTRLAPKWYQPRVN